MDLSTFRCPECGEYESDKLDSLRIHCQKRHNLPSIDLYKKLFLNGKEPTCECGCGQVPRFHSLQVGYMKFIRGHASRIHNNWGHNEEAREKSLKKRRDEGLWSKDPWNRGKTKEDDIRVADIGKKIQERHGERYSTLMRDNRLSGVIPSLTGSAHPHWRGGTSALAPLVRSHLYSRWTFPKLKEGGFKCARCGSTSDLEVHHSGERFATILHKAVELFGEPGESFQVKSQISEWVTDYHVEQNIPGTPLCIPCHDSLHAAEEALETAVVF